jgi:CBS domain-containing protein
VTRHLVLAPTVADAMVTRPKVCPADVTVAEVRAQFADDHVHAALVVDGEVLIAVATREDLEGMDGRLPAWSVGSLTDRVVAGEQDLIAVFGQMTVNGTRRLAVTDGDGRLRGLLCRKQHGRGFCSDVDVAARRCP